VTRPSGMGVLSEIGKRKHELGLGWEQFVLNGILSACWACNSWHSTPAHVQRGIGKAISTERQSWKKLLNANAQLSGKEKPLAPGVLTGKKGP